MSQQILNVEDSNAHNFDRVCGWYRRRICYHARDFTCLIINALILAPLNVEGYNNDE